MPHRRRRTMLGLCALAVACVVAMSAPSRTAQALPADDVVLAGAGDISTCANDNDEATAALLDNIAGSVFTLGDNVYENGTGAEFSACYDPTWGRHKLRTRPTSGNHEYNTAGAMAYYGYFGAAAGDPARGYYSYDAGSFWHVIVLNSECAAIGGCDAGTPQETWLRADLAANSSKNVIAMMHKPRFSSGTNVTTTQALWDALYSSGADLVLTGHDHDYERFAPQTAGGVADGTYGMREFVVGTGGRSLATFGTIKPNSELHDNSTYGVLKLTLHPSSYDWEFVPVAGQTFTDSGTSQVHGAPPPPTATATATATSPPTPTRTPTMTATAGPTSTPGATSVFGITTSAGVNDSSDSGYINGSRFALPTPGTLSSLSVFVGSTPTNAHVRLALYSNDGAGNPGALIAQTGQAVAVAGWNTLPVVAGAPLAAGTYWIVAQTDNGATVYRSATGLSAANFVGWAPYGYGAFPSAIAGWAKFANESFDMYGTVALGGAPTATASTVPSATATRTPTATATAVPTAASTSVPTATSTPTATATGTALPTATSTASATSTTTATSTATATPTPTSTASPTATNASQPTLTATSTSTPTPTSTAVPTASSTSQPTVTATSTSTPTPTSTAVPTATSTATSTRTPAPSPSATNTPQAVVLFGLTTSGGANDSSDFGYANGSLFPLSANGTLTALSVYVGATPAGAHIRLAIYTNDGSGNPGALKAQTGEATAAPGWNTISVPGGASLSVGTYWIVAQTDNMGTVYRIATGLSVTSYEGYGALSYGAFPPTIGGWSKIVRRAFDMYGTLTTVPTATPTP